MIAIDLSKQQEPDADPKPIQQFNFTRNLDRPGSTKIFSIIEEAKENVLEFLQGAVNVLWILSYDLPTTCFKIYFCFNTISI